MHTLQKNIWKQSEYAEAYTHSSVFQLSCRAKHWPSSYCFTLNDHQVARIFLVLLQPVRRALSKRPFHCRFCLHPPIRQQTILSDGKVSQYLGAGKATFVCGSCTCRLHRFDAIRRKYEAVKEDLEAQKREILALWRAQAQAQPQPHPQRVSCDSASQLDSSMEKLPVWTQIGTDWMREFVWFWEKPMIWSSVWIFDFQHCQGSVAEAVPCAWCSLNDRAVQEAVQMNETGKVLYSWAMCQ